MALTTLSTYPPMQSVKQRMETLRHLRPGLSDSESTKAGLLNGLSKTTQITTVGASKILKDSKGKFLRLSMTGKIGITAFVSFVFGTIGIYFAETGITAGNIKTLGDAVWWCVVTMATVGYGDKYPVSTIGRFIAVVVMLGGCTTFALFVGYIGGIFRDKELENNGKIDTVEELAAEVKALRAELKLASDSQSQPVRH